MLASAGEVVGIVVVVALAAVGVATVSGSASSRSSSRGVWCLVERLGSSSRSTSRTCGPGPVHRQDGEDRRARVPDDRGPAGRDHEGQRFSPGQRDHLLPGDRRQVGALRNQRLPARGRPALAGRPCGPSSGSFSLDQALSERGRSTAACRTTWQTPRRSGGCG